VKVFILACCLSSLPVAVRRAVLLLVVFTLLTGCAASSGHLALDERPVLPEKSAKPEYRLGPGDVININVWKNPDLSVQNVPVRPDGYISVPLVGDILAGNRTPAEISADAEEKLLQFIRTPKVSTIVVELNSAEFQNRVRVVGGVAEPKSISHRDGMTVIDLVLEAGGVNEFSSPEGTKLYRTIAGETKAYPIFLDSILQDGILDTNYPLLPGDVIAVPERRF